MKSYRPIAVTLALVAALSCVQISRADAPATVGGATWDQLPDLPMPGGAKMLPNGWKLSPAGRSTQLAGDMPTAMVLTPDQKFVLTATGGYNEHGISVVELATGKMVDHVAVPATFAGMCIDRTGTHVRLSPGGFSNSTTLYAFRFDNGQLRKEAGFDVAALPAARRFIGGLACNADGAVFIANVGENRIYKASADGKQASSTEVGYRPCAIRLSPDEQMLAVANWGDESIDLLSAADLKHVFKVKVGSHPAAVEWSSDGRVFVANAGGDTVSVVDAHSGRVMETIRTSLDFQIPVGSTPLAMAVDRVGKRLYVANADNNDVAVVDIADRDESRVLGFIPTGWYPCALAISGDGKKLCIGTGKALDAFVPNKPPTYIGRLLTGHVSIVDAPTEATLAGYTRQVLANTPRPRTANELTKSQADTLASAFGKIKHVIYVIKENRTYDQVFGDIPKGNGDPSLCMFGRKVTPNHHALAENWVLLDNLYCNGEVSVDGHAWCDAAYASDFTQRSWTNTYSKRPGLDADDRLNRQPGGYIWDNAIAHGLSFMSYGEGASFLATPDTAPDVDDDDAIKGGAFSKAWQKGSWKMGAGLEDYERMKVFIDDLKAAEKTGNWPALTVMSLPEDHTAGRRVGKKTPDACVASNDLALGQLVEAVSHSRFWPETAIFVIEDDAQNGQDHVDAHRTIGLVISPYVKRGTVDHTMYTTASMIRSIELMLHLPPMTQYDAAATPMFASFMLTPDTHPYTALPAQIDLNATNPKKNPGAQASAALDWSDLDRADPDKLNAILWQWFKPNLPVPAPVRSMVLVQ
ncbi:MAG: bifunctional YncE family protein/alkaline phosphatase family protein [Tepidisphaeraceae bacterium]